MQLHFTGIFPDHVHLYRLTAITSSSCCTDNYNKLANSDFPDNTTLFRFLPDHADSSIVMHKHSASLSSLPTSWSPDNSDCAPFGALPELLERQARRLASYRPPSVECAGIHRISFRAQSRSTLLEMRMSMT